VWNARLEGLYGERNETDCSDNETRGVSEIVYGSEDTTTKKTVAFELGFSGVFAACHCSFFDWYIESLEISISRCGVERTGRHPRTLVSHLSHDLSLVSVAPFGAFSIDRFSQCYFLVW